MTRHFSNKFNRGEIDDLALAREDVARINNSASSMVDFLPMRLGPMMYRPGTEYLGPVAGEAYFVEFIRATDDLAALEFSNNLMRVWVDDEVITRTAVITPLTNGAFDSDITGWTDNSGAGSTTSWKTGGYASLQGAGSTKAILYQTLTPTDTGSEHGLRIVVVQAPIILKIGTSGVSSFDIYNGTLLPGTHSLSVTPSSDITLTFENSKKYEALIDSVAFEGAAVMTLPTAVTTAKLSSIL